MVEIHEVERALLRARPAVVTAPQIADELDCSSEHVRQHLSALEAVEKAESLSAGARAKVYWHPSRTTPPEQPPEDHPDQARLDHDPSGGVEERGDQEASSDDQDDGQDDPVATLDLPGSGETLERRRDAVRACLQYLRREGSATKKEFIDNVFSENPAGYQSSGGWWNAIGAGVREVAEQRDELVAPSEGSRTYERVGQLEEQDG
jgi:hypothetical protein